MTQKDFWPKSTVAVIGGGAFGTILAHLVSKNCMDVRVWVREEERARAINATRNNPDYVNELQLGERVHAFTSLERIFEREIHAVIWALPSDVCRTQAKALARYFRGDEVILHATKGIEEGSLKRITEILKEELPCRRIGIISGPNLANEIAKGEPAATVVASAFDEVLIAGQALLSSEKFRVYTAKDIIGVEWGGVLKNVFAIAAGALDGLNYGWNARAMLITRSLAEMVRFGTAMGADQSTFLGLSGIGDLMATCCSPQSRNYRVGAGLATGKSLEQVVEDLGSTAEGVKTARYVWDFAQSRGISMPITQGVYQILYEKKSVKDVLHSLMTRPPVSESASL